MEDFQFASIIVSTVRNAPVLIFAAMAGLFAERSGVVDIGLEGKILASAFVSAAVAYTYQDPWIGIAIALMGRQHPVGIFLSSVLFGALIQGGFDLSLEKPNIPVETFVFIQGLIILFCGAMENFYAPAVLKLINATRKG